ncbi:MAG: hypothetical protein PUP92_26275 [Rhizonema sp. PD38]|nr:hypothetical protein [Rhizonema sp. PD38]
MTNVQHPDTRVRCRDYGCRACWHGHWLWMIPTDTQSMELSIGIIQHHDVIPAESINTQEKFEGKP